MLSLSKKTSASYWYRSYRYVSLGFILFLSSYINYSAAQSADSNGNRIDFAASYIEQPRIKNTRHYMDTKVDFDIYLNAVTNSGKVVNRGDQIDYLNTLVKDLTGHIGKSICLLKSNIFGTFSTDSTIYITTGLIAQLENKDQLLFFIARELVSDKQSQFWNDGQRRKMIGSSYNEKINSLISRTLSEDMDLDLKSYELIKSKVQNTNCVLSCLEAMKYSHLPFEITEVPDDYLNSNEYFVPSNYFQISEVKNYSSGDTSYDSRILKRIQNMSLEKTEVEISPENELEFLELLKSARFDYLDEAISNGEFEIALYVIFLLETRYDKMPILAEKKALAWYGFALREMQVIPGKKSDYYQGLLNSGINFLLTLRRLPDPAKISLALRAVGDGKNTSVERTQLWKSLLFHINDYAFIDLHEFHTNNYYSEFRTEVIPKLTPVGSKSEKLQTIENQKSLDQKRDSTKFYLYGLSDFVRDSSFWSELNSLKAKPLDPASTFKVFPSISYNARRRTNYTKSTKALEELIKELRKENKFKKVIKIDSLNVGNQNALKTRFSEQFGISNYEVTVPIKADFTNRDLLDSDADYLVFPLFQSTFRPRPKPAYFVGLFVVPLPFIISDFLLKSYQSSYAILVVNAKTNEVVYTEYMKYNEPLTNTNMKERIVNSINQITVIQ